ncbi:Zeatin O-xylosyltransferase [Sesamum angolense]|uniref:Glycosyltransferase n=1 Tax=Sesamum angolense TaxID=2727404 RepID=A0AAE2BP61_9LAMI|nr:Zeatin O-xylosyltransferase [Sesamum angolense]
MSSLSNQQRQHDDQTSMEQVAVIMVPFAAQGHLNQLMQLSCLVSSYGLPVSYISSATHIRQARVRVNGLNPLDVAKIHFHDIPVPAFASPPPDPNSSSKFPEQLQPAWDASLSLRQPFAEYLREMSEKFKRVVVVHDPMMAAVVQDVISIHNAESYAFIPAFSQAFFIGEGLLDSSAEHLKELASLQECVPKKVLEFVAIQTEPLKYRAGDLYNTCRLIEALYLDLLEKEESGGNRKSWAIGPILPTKLSSAAKPANKCLEWLDQQEPNSVIYVSFGTTVSLSDEQIKELALGLEQSKVKFLWVLRDADKADIFDGQVRRAELPEGFEERVKEVGMVVRDWAPQPEILAHKSTGGFMSHCGWNSCIESITMGVPIAAWPMHSDQPRNTMFVTQVLKIGIAVMDWEQRTEPVQASAIENAVRRLMASEEGDAIRKWVEELAATLRQATEPGGASRLELDSFVAHITR